MSTKVFVALPIYGMAPWQFTSCFVKELIQNQPCALEISPLVGDSLVSRARNTLSALFLKSDCTHLLFIDSDLVYSSEHIKRLISHDKDVVCGFYPKKQDGPLEWVCNAKLEGAETDENGLTEVRYMGTGFMLVKRCVFDRMIGRYGDQISYHPDSKPEETEWDFWSVGVHQSPDGFRRYLSEDWFFCQRWLELGGKVYGDTKIILKHVGQAVYPLQSQMPSMMVLPNADATSSAA